jgi:hypothetical protein
MRDAWDQSPWGHVGHAPSSMGQLDLWVKVMDSGYIYIYNFQSIYSSSKGSTPFNSIRICRMMRHDGYMGTPSITVYHYSRVHGYSTKFFDMQSYYSNS